MATPSNSWLKKKLLPLLYRIAKRCVQALPASLFRFRPFGIYEIVLPATGSTVPSKADSNGWQASWISNPTEAQVLDQLAAQENIANCNETTHRAAVAWQGSKPIGVAWIATGSFSEQDLGLRFQLRSGEAWLFAAVVDPAARNQGIYQHLLQFICQGLADEHYDRILLGVSLGNQPSLRAHSKLGANQLGTIYAVKSCGLSYCKVKGAIEKVKKRLFALLSTTELKVQ